MKFRYFWFFLALAGRQLFSVDPVYKAGPQAENIAYVHVVRARPDTKHPWAIPAMEEAHGTASLIRASETYYVTDYNLVRNATSIQIKDGGKTSVATLHFSAPDAGLALLKTEEKPSGRGLLLDDQTVTEAGISIFGFYERSKPGQITSTVSGLSSELLSGSDVDRRLLILLKQLPELSGFSGGPIIQDGRLIGLLHYEGQKSYGIHASVIRHVLADIENDDKRYDGFPDPGIIFRPLTGAAERKFFGLDRTLGGVFVSRISRQSSWNNLIKPGDVLYEINGNPINIYGEVILAIRRYTLLDYIASQQAGQVKAKIVRNGQRYGLDIPLKANPIFDNRRRRPFELRKYFMGAGLVFQELDYELIHDSGASSTEMRYRYQNFIADELSQEADADIVLVDVLPDHSNRGADKYRMRVLESINGQRIRSLDHFVSEWKRAQGRFIALKFINDPARLALEHSMIPAAEQRIFNTYQFQENGRIK